MQRMVGKVIVDPPCHVSPTATSLDMVYQPGQHDASCGTVLALGIRVVPNVCRVVGRIAGATTGAGSCACFEYLVKSRAEFQHYVYIKVSVASAVKAAVSVLPADLVRCFHEVFVE